MFIIESYSTAVIFCLITMMCWGSWANTQKLTASTWRFELFYWDYVIGIVLLSLVLGLTMGSIGTGGRPFLEDLQQGSFANLRSAFIGGMVFNAANILLGAAIAIAGMSVAFPVGIGLALVIGVIVNYVDQPVGDVPLLFGGVALVAVAIVLNAIAYRQKGGNTGVSTRGLLLSVISGAMMGLFYKYVANAMFSDFTVPIDGKLSPYSAVFVFSLGILASNIVFNTILMAKPVSGTPVGYGDYFKGTIGNHLTGMLGGVIWCIGMSFSIIASGKAGAAISYGLGQGATVVAAVWGIFVWREFAGASSSVRM
ncbi:MAG: GRP family sugar transporter, partial [Cyclobacteriaceae bacterium]|nr:GRP family sugar transporter [Cyclobacteriaceae bacterium]